MVLRNDSCLGLVGFGVYLFVGEGSDAAGLILETGLSSLLYVAHVPQIPDQNSSPSRANNQPVSGHRERVNLTGGDVVHFTKLSHYNNYQVLTVLQ